jgi:hypothetical protein
MVLLTHVREIHISDAIILVKTDQKPSISDRDVSGHDDVSSVHRYQLVLSALLRVGTLPNGITMKPAFVKSGCTLGWFWRRGMVS